MQKVKPLILFIFFGTNLFGQQSILKGIVSIHNSEFETGKRIYVGNAQVEDNFGKAQPVITNDSGWFRLTYVGIPENSSVSFSVRKPNTDLEVVNISSLDAITGQNTLVKISMASKKKIADYRKKIYQVGISTAEKILKVQIQKQEIEINQYIEKNKDDSLKIKELKKNIAKLEDKQIQIEVNAKEFATKYSLLNLDDATPLIRNALKIFQAGHIDSALKILTDANLENLAYLMISDRKKLNTQIANLHISDSIQRALTKDIADALVLEGKLYRTSLEYDSATKIFLLAVKLDSTNGSYLFAYAQALRMLNQLDSAILYYQKAIAAFLNTKDNLLNEQSLAATNLNLGETYQSKNELDSAKVFYLLAKDSYKKLAKRDTLYYPFISMVDINLGTYYNAIKDIPKSQSSFEEAIDVLNKFKRTNESLKPNLGVAFAGYAELWILKGDNDKAEKYYLDALTIFRNIPKENPEKNKLFPTCLINLGTFYGKIKHDTIKSEKFYFEGLDNYRRLSLLNPEKYNAPLAQVETNLAILNSKRDPKKTELYYLEAIKIYNDLVKSNPLYLSNIAKINDDLGVVSFLNGNVLKAEEYIHKAINLYREVEKIDSGYLKNESNSHATLGALYFNTKFYDKSIYEFHESFRINQMFNYYYYSAEIDTSNLYIYKNLGASYKNIGDFSSSIHFFFLAINECKILDSFNKMKYNYQEASLEKDLGIVYKMEKKYDSSSLHFLKAYTIYKFLGGTTMLDCQLLKVDIELNSARIYSSKNDLKNSEKSFLNALDIIKSLESINIKVPQKTIADITSELVEIFVIEQNFDQAEFYSLKILKIYEKEVCENYIVCEGFVITENNLGTIYSLKKKYTRAEIFYLRAIKNYQLIRKNDSIKYSNTIARCFIDLGKVYESTRNLSNAKDAFNTALQLYIGLKDSHDHSKIIEELKNKLKELDNL